MIFIYRLRELVLAEKEIQATLKKDLSKQDFKLQIVVHYTKLIIHFTGGFIKVARLYDKDGKLISPLKYSPEIKDEIRALKRQCSIPYLKLWKGFLIIVAGLLIWSVIFGMYNKRKNKESVENFNVTKAKVLSIHPGQLFAGTFFADNHGNSVDGLPAGWIRVIKLQNDTLFIQRSKALSHDIILFDIEKLQSIKPQTNDDWEPIIEKINYGLMQKNIENESKSQSINLLNIGTDGYNGVVFSIKGAE